MAAHHTKSLLPWYVAYAMCLCLCMDARTALANPWELKKQADGIEVYTRPVEGSDIREFKSEGMVSVDVGSIVALLRDAARFKNWFPDTSESRLLKREGAVSYQYSVMSTPWPINDRDLIFRSVLKQNEITGQVEIEINAAPDAHPVQDDLHRVTHAIGSWQFTPDGPNRTHVKFTMHLEPGGGIPDWMVNARIVATPFNALVNLRDILGADPNK
jgi:hypothetical protein